jgi:hypothetical protein
VIPNKACSTAPQERKFGYDSVRKVVSHFRGDVGAILGISVAGKVELMHNEGIDFRRSGKVANTSPVVGLNP